MRNTYSYVRGDNKGWGWDDSLQVLHLKAAAPTLCRFFKCLYSAAGWAPDGIKGMEPSEGCLHQLPVLTTRYIDFYTQQGYKKATG